MAWGGYAPPHNKSLTMIMVRTQFTQNNLQTMSILILFIYIKKNKIKLKKRRRQVQWLIYLTMEKFNSKHSVCLLSSNSTCSSKKIKESPSKQEKLSSWLNHLIKVCCLIAFKNEMPLGCSWKILLILPNPERTNSLGNAKAKSWHKIHIKK